jgi:hypothetical protein
MIVIHGSEFMGMEMIEYLNKEYPLYDITIKEHELIEIDDGHGVRFMIPNYNMPRKVNVEFDVIGLTNISMEFDVICASGVLNNIGKFNTIAINLLEIIRTKKQLHDKKNKLSTLEYNSEELKLIGLETKLDRLCDIFDIGYRVKAIWNYDKVDYELKFGEKHFGLGKVL